MTKTKGGVLTAAPLTVTIGDERFDLIPNLRAVKALTPVFDGLLPAFTRVRNIDPDTTVAVVLAASGVTKSAEETGLGTWVNALSQLRWG